MQRILRPDLVAPSQDYLKPQTVRFILRCLAENNFQALPPAPIVRTDTDGAYVAIDGHNMLAVMAYMGEDIEVHVAGSASDGLPPTTEENRARNRDLEEKFDVSLTERQRVAKEGVRTFADLIERNKVLFTGDKI